MKVVIPVSATKFLFITGIAFFYEMLFIQEYSFFTMFHLMIVNMLFIKISKKTHRNMVDIDLYMVVSRFFKSFDKVWTGIFISRDNIIIFISCSHCFCKTQLYSLKSRKVPVNIVSHCREVHVI